MRRSVIIQAATPSSDSQGGQTETWATFATVWASLEPVSGNEKYQAMQLQTPISHKLMIRYLSGLTTKHRVLYGSRIFVIKEVINVKEENAYMMIRAIEKVA
jgi:SPP1 family predicted phage head-tail adaptor